MSEGPAITLPRVLDIKDFAAARDQEVRALLQALAGRESKRPLGSLPRHLRRRTHSHNLRKHRKRPNRVLRAKRKEAEEQAGLEAWSAARHPLERPLIRDDVLRGAGLPLLRAARRRPERMAIETLRALLETAGPLSEAPERPAKRPTEADGATDGSEGPARKRRRLDTGDASAEDRPTPTLRLMTHRWHAKRMQMGRRWGMSVCEGAAGRGRGSRAVLQSLSTSFVLHDASYYEWVGLKGPVEAVGRMLRQCGVPSAVLDDPEVLSGGREFQVELVQPGGRVVCPATLFFAPAAAMASGAAKGDAGCLLSVHRASYRAAVRLLSRTAQGGCRTQPAMGGGALDADAVGVRGGGAREGGAEHNVGTARASEQEGSGVAPSGRQADPSLLSVEVVPLGHTLFRLEMWGKRALSAVTGSLVPSSHMPRKGDSQSIDTTATSPAASLLAMTRTFGADAWRRVPPGSVLSFSTPDPRLVMATQSGSVGSRNRANKQGGSRRGRVDGGSGANSIRGGAASAGTSVDKKGKGLGARVGRAVTRTAAQVARGEGGATLTEGRVEGMWGFLQGASGAQGVWDGLCAPLPDSAVAVVRRAHVQSAMCLGSRWEDAFADNRAPSATPSTARKGRRGVERTKAVATPESVGMAPCTPGAFSQDCPLMVSVHPTGTGTYPRVTVVGPVAWAAPIFAALARQGARVAGQREWRWCHASQGVPLFPYDLPGTDAFVRTRAEDGKRLGGWGAARPSGRVSLRRVAAVPVSDVGKVVRLEGGGLGTTGVRTSRKGRGSGQSDVGGGEGGGAGDAGVDGEGGSGRGQGREQRSTATSEGDGEGRPDRRVALTDSPSLVEGLMCHVAARGATSAAVEVGEALASRQVRFLSAGARAGALVPVAIAPKRRGRLEEGARVMVRAGPGRARVVGVVTSAVPAGTRLGVGACAAEWLQGARDGAGAGAGRRAVRVFVEDKGQGGRLVEASVWAGDARRRAVRCAR